MFTAGLEIGSKPVYNNTLSINSKLSSPGTNYLLKKNLTNNLLSCGVGGGSLVVRIVGFSGPGFEFCDLPTVSCSPTISSFGNCQCTQKSNGT